uniref:Major sperm protein n=1 Tax=Meloidogyne enterolobii TaxID=390850 RepID=A0A6V7U963_MELEN|nr:unnamed protein product [Meloidogyne enterolobii]
MKSSLPPSPANSSSSSNQQLIQQINSAANETPGSLLIFPSKKLVISNCQRFKQANSLYFKRTPKRINAKPGVGILQPNESKSIEIICQGFDIQSTDTTADRIVFVWTNVEANTPKFKWAFFSGDGVKRRKNIYIEYNH